MANPGGWDRFVKQVLSYTPGVASTRNTGLSERPSQSSSETSSDQTYNAIDEIPIRTTKPARDRWQAGSILGQVQNLKHHHDSSTVQSRESLVAQTPKDESLVTGTRAPPYEYLRNDSQAFEDSFGSYSPTPSEADVMENIPLDHSAAFEQDEAQALPGPSDVSSPSNGARSRNLIHLLSESNLDETLDRIWRTCCSR